MDNSMKNTKLHNNIEELVLFVFAMAVLLFMVIYWI